MNGASRVTRDPAVHEREPQGIRATAGSVVRLNIGCGPTPTPGWINYDNSWSVRLARHRLTAAALTRAGLLTAPQVHLCRVARAETVRLGNATAILHGDDEVDVVYSSHMLEHLDRASALRFLAEAHRVLRPGGVLRVAVPDLALLIERYNADGDADELVASSLLAPEPTPTLRARLKYVVLGNRNHAWMYDAKSLVALVEAAGFERVARVAAGETRIADPGALDLSERAHESVYVEASKPATSA